MAGQRDLARKRLEQLIEIEQQSGGHLQYFEPWEATAFALEQEARDVPIWDDPKTRACAAELALSLTNADCDEPIRKAFDSFGLDPRNPFHWRRLLWYLAEAFWARSKKGAPQKWSAHQLCRLLRHFDEVRKEKENLELSEASICQRVKNRFHRAYAGISAGTIKRNPYARDPQRNLVLGHLYETYRTKMNRDAEAEHGTPLAAEIQSRIEGQALEKAIQQIALPPHRTRRKMILDPDVLYAPPTEKRF